MIVFVIKNLRNKNNISLSQLSQLTNLSRAYLRKLENNENNNPTISSLLKVSEALNVNIKQLFYTKLDIDDLKEEMYERIDKFGLNSKEVMEISQIIDLLVNIDLASQCIDKNNS